MVTQNESVLKPGPTSNLNSVWAESNRVNANIILDPIRIHAYMYIKI
jgi:hypothetical protein